MDWMADGLDGSTDWTSSAIDGSRWIGWLAMGRARQWMDRRRTMDGNGRLGVAWDGLGNGWLGVSR